MEKTQLLNQDVKSIFYSFLIPSVGGMLGTAIYLLGDTIIVGRALGGRGLAAISLTLPIFRFVNAMGMMFAVGGATTLSILRGKGRDQEANDVFNIAIILSALVGLILIFIRLFAFEWLIKLLGTTDYTYDMVKSYLGIYLYFNVFTILNTALGVFVRNDGSPKIVMTATLVSAIFNIVLDYILIFNMDTGIWGAAFATAVSPILGISILLSHFFRGKNLLRFSLPKWDGHRVKRIIRNGFPSFILEFSIGIVIYLFNITLLKVGGDLAVSAYGIIMNLGLIVSSIFNGVAQAIQPIVSINYGAGREDRVKEAGRIGIKTSIVFGLVIFILGNIFPSQLASVFTKDKGELIALTARAIRIYFIAFLFMGVNVSIIAYVQSREEIRSSILISMLRGSIFIIVFLMILPRFLGVDGVWLTITFAEIATMFTYLILYEDTRELIKSIKS